MIRENDHNLPMTFLKPAELCISETPVVVQTVLGSCVSVTMFNKRTGVAAICHAVMPVLRKGACVENGERYKYVDHVVPEMLAKMREYGVNPSEIEVKIFGGAEVLHRPDSNRSSMSIGRSNVKTALAMLEAEGLKIKAADVAGTTGRKIYFYTDTGDVFLKRVKKIESIAIHGESV
jgi:chemotaxis protein CheD